MLTTLRIKNLALVADLTLELQPGCNVITGETGAGKSIILGALNLVLGERADRTLLRSGSDACSVEAVFEISRGRRREGAESSSLPRRLQVFLDENGLERVRTINWFSSELFPTRERTGSSSTARPPP